VNTRETQSYCHQPLPVDTSSRNSLEIFEIPPELLRIIIVMSPPPSADVLPVDPNSKKPLLVALDFDFTVIDDDSDHWVFDKLSPTLRQKVNVMTHVQEMILI
jgi:hypothetical protein